MRCIMTLKVGQIFLCIDQNSKLFLQVFLVLPIMMGTFLTGILENISKINKMSSNLVQL